LFALAVGLVLAAIGGLFAYMSATARPLHPEVSAVSSVSRSTPGREWAAAVAAAEQAVRAGLVEQNLPGVSVAVGVDGDLVWAEGFGWADLERQLPVDPGTRFRAAEVSMPLTSAAAGLLLEKHRLDLDSEIQAYVPEFPKKQWPVTLREVMAHVAGIRNDAGDEEPLMERCARTADGLRRFAGSALLFEPGTRFHVSSYGWILVSAAIEAAAEQPFFSFMRDRVFAPLGMDDTSVDLMSDDVADRATFYYPRFAGDNRYGPELAREGDHSCFAGASGFLSTPSDLVRFAMAVNGGRLLQPETVRLLQTPQRLASGEETGYGLGWAIATVPLAGAPTRMAGQSSRQDFIGGTASLLTFPDRRLAVAVMSNTGFADTKSLALKVADIFAAQAPVAPRPHQ
jgi:CubicO group peptidase (beta-lactamase class C family)